MEASEGGQATGARRASIKWSAEMEQAYEAALAGAGGLEVAKPKAVWELMKDEWPDITLQNVKWHLLAHRRREERHREQGAPETQILKWTGRLEAAYEAAVVQLGGLQAARPKQLLDILQPEFPELQLQQVKWHLQKQRTKQQAAQQSSDQREESEDEEGESARRTQRQGASSRQQRDSAAAGPSPASTQPLPRAAAWRASSGNGGLPAAAAPPQPHPFPGGGPVPLRYQAPLQFAQAPPVSLPMQSGPYSASHSLRSHQLVELPVPNLSSGPPPNLSVLSHSGARGGGADPAAAAAAQQQQQMAAVQRVLQQQAGWQQQPRYQLLPWEPFLLPEAHRALARLARAILCYRQVVAYLHQRASQLEQLIQQLEQQQAEKARQREFAALVGLDEAPPSSSTAAVGGLQLDVQQLARQLLALGGGPGDGRPPPHGGGRNTRTQAALASSFTVVREGGAAAAAAAAMQQQVLQQQGGAQHLASCRVAGCRQCAWLRRTLPAAQQQPGGVPASNPP